MKNKITEINVLLIYQFGIYVIESKELVGYRIMKETSSGFKPFIRIPKINSIIQSCKMKIIWKHWSKFYKIFITSIIIFGERATLKKITYTSNHVLVMKYDRELSSFLPSSNILNENQIQKIYKKLLKYTNVPEETKVSHIEYVKNIFTKNLKHY